MSVIVGRTQTATAHGRSCARSWRNAASRSTTSPTRRPGVDYPDVADRVARAVAAGDADRGILVCGTGIGMSIVANKVPGIRAALAHDAYSAERAIKSNNAQVLTMGALVIGPAADEDDRPHLDRRGVGRGRRPPRRRSTGSSRSRRIDGGRPRRAP